MLSLTLFGALTISQRINAVPEQDGIDYWDPTYTTSVKPKMEVRGIAGRKSYDCICSSDPNPECIKCNGRNADG